MVSSADILNARILIVDDKEANLLLLERMLRGAGYAAVSSTTDPSRVCELHRDKRYGLRQFGADSVTASSIFVNTATDVASMGILLGLASILVV